MKDAMGRIRSSWIASTALVTGESLVVPKFMCGTCIHPNPSTRNEKREGVWESGATRSAVSLDRRSSTLRWTKEWARERSKRRMKPGIGFTFFKPIIYQSRAVPGLSPTDSDGYVLSLSLPLSHSLSLSLPFSLSRLVERQNRAYGLTDPSHGRKIMSLFKGRKFSLARLENRFLYFVRVTWLRCIWCWTEYPNGPLNSNGRQSLTRKFIRHGKSTAILTVLHFRLPGVLSFAVC